MKKANRLKLTLIFLIITSFFFTGLAEGLMYFVVFASNFYKKKCDPLIIFPISVFWDVYSYSFVGISLAQLMIFYFFSRKYRPAFQNFKINTGCLFLFLCCTKLLSFVLVSFLGYGYDVRSNGMQIFYTLLIHSIYYFFRVTRESTYHV
jgi:hypothetical protein